jgi:IS4 transposase
MTPNDIINLIPDSLFEFLASETQVDRKVHKLKGKMMFQLLMYTLITTKKGSLRVMEQVFKSYAFKSCFSIGFDKNTKFNSIRDRIDTIKVVYFEQLFESCYDLYGKQLGEVEKPGLKTIRFDSTMVALSSKLLSIGMKVGSKTNKKQVKFTIGFDGLLPKSGKLFKEQNELSEDITLRDAIINGSVGKDDIVVFDRGLQKRKTFGEFSEKPWKFVTRLKTNSLFKVIKETPLTTVCSDTVEIAHDDIVHLYGEKHKELEIPFRLVRGVKKSNGEEIWFLTDILDDMSAVEISEIYKKRWAIEVFFKFLKQELNFDHLLVRTENGLKVTMYATLITAMLVLVYKSFNKLKGYKITKLRFALELEETIIEQIVILCGGDPKKMYLSSA